MNELIIHAENIGDLNELTRYCPFGAIVIQQGAPVITAACKMCRVCVKKGPPGVFELRQAPDRPLDLSQWRGIAVYVEHEQGVVHPVTLELLGKAAQLARVSPQPLHCVFIGHDIGRAAQKLLQYGPDSIFVYEHRDLEHFRIEPYSAAFADYIASQRPSVVLVGGTTVGRSLAPRLAARFRTGLTADCTSLEIRPDSALEQIRPAFGGNIMARILTPKRRPQFATVRYKIFPMPLAEERGHGEIIFRPLQDAWLQSGIDVLEVIPKPRVKGIEEAEVIVAAGRAIKKAEELEMVRELAALLGGEVAGTRSLIESGLLEPQRQIGLSGRTVKPKLIITCGISGAIQFVAGMRGSETIVSINTDSEANIFKIAHYGLVGDLFKIVPALNELIRRDHG